VTYEELLEQIIERDKNDSTRDIAPLTKADDAIEIDTSKLTVQQVVDKIIEIVKERCML
ncbi:MAG TPA: (d)CMP kinase, partial [Fervidobacterium sp.]|nr:(d)CMP kinase [Fervidobacterium sp.]